MKTNFIKERLSTLNLNVGETKVIGVRPTKNVGEVQLVFAEKIDRPSNRRALGDFNASDENFGSRNAQPVWLKAMIADVAKLMPQALSAAKQAIEDQDYVSLDITNPKLGDQRLRVEITETHKPSKWEQENIEFAAKQDGEGNYLHWNQLAIFMDADIVKGEPQHRFIQHTGTTTDVFELDYATSDYQPELMEDAIFEKNGIDQPELA